MSFRELYGLAPKATHRCAECGIEHRGRCPMERVRILRRNKATPEQIRHYNEMVKEHKRLQLTRWWIKQLGDFVDEARYTD